MSETEDYNNMSETEEHNHMSNVDDHNPTSETEEHNPTSETEKYDAEVKFIGFSKKPKGVTVPVERGDTYSTGTKKVLELVKERFDEKSDGIGCSGVTVEVEAVYDNGDVDYISNPDAGEHAIINKYHDGYHIVARRIDSRVISGQPLITP